MSSGNRVEAVRAGDGRLVCDHCTVADHFTARLKGLLGRRGLPHGSGLFLSPCSSVHTLFMRFTIDVVFLDRDLRVVGIVPNLRPWRFAGRRGAHYALELRAGEAERHGLRAGERLTLELDAARRGYAPTSTTHVAR